MSEKLHWRASIPYFFAYKDDVIIEVPYEVFQKHFVALLAQQGLAFKTWNQLEREARDAWEKQCTIETALKENLDYWLSLDGQEVQIRQLAMECHNEQR